MLQVLLVVAILGGALIMLRFVYRALMSALEQRRLKRERVGFGVHDFIEQLGKEGVDEEFARRLHIYFQNLVGVQDFPVMPGDPLVAMYGVDCWGGVELSDILEDLTGINEWEQRLKGEVEGLVTVRDLALLITRGVVGS